MDDIYKVVRLLCDTFPSATFSPAEWCRYRDSPWPWDEDRTAFPTRRGHLSRQPRWFHIPAPSRSCRSNFSTNSSTLSRNSSRSPLFPGPESPSCRTICARPRSSWSFVCSYPAPKRSPRLLSACCRRCDVTS